MGLAVAKVHPEDFERVYPLLAGFTNVTKLSKEDWRRQFHSPWGSHRDYCGYMLLNEDQPVGFLGLLFSQRMVRGIQHEFCDLAAWIVKDEHRSESLSLIFPLLGEKNLTITTFTASNRVTTVLKKLGFQDVETDLRFILPLPAVHRNVHIIFDPEEISARLSGDVKQIFMDHHAQRCWHVLLQTPDGPCYVMLNRTRKKRFNVGNIDFLSDRQIFAKYVTRCSAAISRHFHVAALLLGGHFGISSLPFTIRVPRRHSLLFRSKTLLPSDIDLIYSEVQLLGLMPT